MPRSIATRPLPPHIQKLPTRLGLLLLGGLVLLPAAIRGQEAAPSIDQQHPIFNAARTGKIEEVKKFLDEGTSVNACTEFGRTPLRVALETGQLEVAREFLRRGFKPTMIYKAHSGGEFIEIGMGALAYAAKAKAEDIVDQLLERGIGAYPTLYGMESFLESPVLMAIQADSPAIVKKLLANARRDVLTKQMKEKSYEYLTACKSTAAIAVLVEGGADIDSSNPIHPEPSVLHTYAQRNWPEGVAKILALGADPTKEDRNKKTPEDFAASDAIKSVLQVATIRTRVERTGMASGGAPQRAPFAIGVIEAAIVESEEAGLARLNDAPVLDLKAVDDRGWTLLNYALKYRFVKLGHALVDRGSDVTHVTEIGSAMISFAANAGDTELVKKMAAKGAEIDAAENGKPTALILATQARDLPMVEALLSLGAKVEPPRQDDRIVWASALMVAAKTGDIALMERMVKAGGDLHAVDSSGENVVFWAVRSGNVEALHWLLNRGAYPHLKTPRGTNAFTLAASLGKLDMVKALAALGLSHPDAVEFAEMSNHDETLQYVRQLNKDSNPNDPAELWNRFEISTDDVRKYIEAGGDVNYAVRCPTPLQAMAGNAEAIELLLKKGADPLKRGRLANSAVFLCMSRMGTLGEDKALNALRKFIEHGVSPNRQEFIYGMVPPEKTPSGDTLLAFAVARGQIKCAYYLLEKGADPSLKSGFLGRDAFDALRETKMIDDAARYELRKLMEQHSAPQEAVRSSPSADLPPSKRKSF